MREKRKRKVNERETETSQQVTKRQCERSEDREMKAENEKLRQKRTERGKNKDWKKKRKENRWS